jgi:hypothetical protein
LPTPYISPSGSHRFNIPARFDEELVNAVNDLLPKIASDGFESVSDIIRTATFEFVTKYSKSDMTKMLAIAEQQARTARIVNELGGIVVVKTLERIGMMVREGLINEAFESATEVLESVHSVKDKAAKTILIAQIKNHPIFKQLDKLKNAQDQS